MTMAEIDRRRGHATEALEAARESARRGDLYGWELDLVERRRRDVEEALRQWWAQDCKEIA